MIGNLKNKNCELDEVSTVKSKRDKGFTLVEILVVIGIIGILSSVVLGTLNRARSSASFARAKVEFKSLATAIQFYSEDYGGMPADVSRGLPPGLEAYLSGGDWPNAPWPNTVYDWDNWDDPDVPGAKIYQISIRFCPLNEPENCTFPNESWAENFDYYSAVYYCVSGNCRPHGSMPIDHPGYCVNC